MQQGTLNNLYWVLEINVHEDTEIIIHNSDKTLKKPKSASVADVIMTTWQRRQNIHRRSTGQSNAKWNLIFKFGQVTLIPTRSDEIAEPRDRHFNTTRWDFKFAGKNTAEFRGTDWQTTIANFCGRGALGIYFARNSCSGKVWSGWH